MAHFHIYLGNHDSVGKRTLFDIIDYVTLGLTHFNHTVTKSSTNVSEHSMNLLFENFRVGQGQALLECGVEFGIIATEYYDGYRLNFDSSTPWRIRLRGLEDVAPHARFIWCMYKDCIGHYSRFAPTTQLRLGSTQVPYHSLRRRTVPVSFFGKPTHYRVGYLEALREADFNVRSYPKFLDNRDYLREVRKSRLVLCIKQNPRWRLPSYARVYRALNEGCGVVSDEFLVDDYLKDYTFLISNRRRSAVSNIIDSITDDEIRAKLSNFHNEMSYVTEWDKVLTFTKTFVRLSARRNSTSKRLPLRLDYFFEWFSLQFLAKTNLKILVLEKIENLVRTHGIDVIWGLGSVEKELDLAKTYHKQLKYLCDKNVKKFQSKEKHGVSIHDPSEVLSDSSLVTLITFPKVYRAGTKRLSGKFIFIEDLIFDSLNQIKDRNVNDYFDWLSRARRSNIGVELKRLIA
jgi:hypothetical protein